jgi:hypothetical protein
VKRALGCGVSDMQTESMSWAARGERSWVMRLAESGSDWIEVKRADAAGSEASWCVVSSFGGREARMRDAFGSKEAAQGSALLLAMRRLPGRRDALHEQLDAIPRAWWWKIMPLDDASTESRSIFSERVAETEESAVRGGRAVGAGWYLYVYGPGCAHAFGRLPA